LTFEYIVKGIFAVMLLSATMGFLLSAASDEALALETHEVEILKGSTTNPIEIGRGDSITFVNKDTVLHTATSGSGSPPTPSGIFDSGFLGPNKVATVTINEVGEFPYYCVAHPTMIGLVKVTEGSGGDNPFTVTATYDGQSFEISGSSATAKASQVTVNPNVSVVVRFDGSGDVRVTFPTSMIQGINSVAANDGTPIPFTKTEESEFSTTIALRVPEGDGSVVIMGARVVPEYSAMAAFIIAGSSAAVSLIVARTSRTFRKSVGS
jgi:plastocyanin